MASPTTRLRLEALESRDAPAVDVALTSLRLESGTVVRFDYRAIDQPGPFQVGLYRSTDAVFDAGDEQLGERVTITPRAVPNAVGFGRFHLSAELPIDPDRKFIIAVADPNEALAETDRSNNTAYFRKLVVGAVTHGFTFATQLPAWAFQLADGLRAAGYDRVVAFDWRPWSGSPLPGGATRAGNLLAGQVRSAANAIADRVNDVVDVHLIGHSRGTSVVSLAFNALAAAAPKSVGLGFWKQTLLDPHVAANKGNLIAGTIELLRNTGTSTIAGISYDPTRVISRTEAKLVLTFQAAARDPRPSVHAKIDAAEVFWQRLPWDQTAVSSDEFQVGLNLLADPPQTLVNRSGKPIRAVDVGVFGVGHNGVPNWYIENELPLI